MQSSYSPEIDPARAIMLRRCDVIHEAVHNTLRATAEYIDDESVLDEKDSLITDQVTNPLFDAPIISETASNYNEYADQARAYVARALEQDKAA